MVKIAMLMPGQSQTDEAIRRIAALGIRGLDWQLYTSPEELSPGGEAVAPAQEASPRDREHTTIVLAGETTADRLVNAGVPKGSAPYFARRLRGGSSVLIASVPSRRAAQVRQVMEEAGGRAADEP